MAATFKPVPGYSSVADMLAAVLPPLAYTPFDERVRAEVDRAAALHPPLRSHDEAMSVLAEEVHEVKLEVYKNGNVRKDEDLGTELVQVAAMAARWATNTKLAGFDDFVRKTQDATAHHRRAVKRPANGPHEALTWLDRAVAPAYTLVLVENPDTATGSGQAGRTPWDAGPGRSRNERLLDALVGIYVQCRRWSEDFNLPCKAVKPTPAASAKSAPPTPDWPAAIARLSARPTLSLAAARETLIQRLQGDPNVYVVGERPKPAAESLVVYTFHKSKAGAYPDQWEGYPVEVKKFGRPPVIGKVL